MGSERIEGVTLGINVFMRSGRLEKCLDAVESLEKLPEEVVVADDSFNKEVNRQICRDCDIDISYVELASDSGASASRNRIVQETSTEFLMLLDEDQYLRDGVMSYLRSVLEKEEKLAGIAPSWIENGVVLTDARDINLESGWVLADTFKQPVEEEAGGKYFYRYDFIATSALYRVEALRDIGWDENYTIGGEHLDFFLSYKLNTRWEFAVTENRKIVHDPGSSCKDYLDERNSFEKLKKSRDYFCSKWGVKGFLFREKHRESYDSFITYLVTEIFYRLPNRFHWFLKGRKEFEYVKGKYGELMGEEFR